MNCSTCSSPLSRCIVCGAVSGNLEVIDLDVKNWAGIDSMLFNSMNLLYSELFHKLRMHRTPSGGYHIIYRVSNGVIPGNLKLAWKEGSKEAAIETRGEGGYIAAPPSLGYSIYTPNPIPTITWEERCALIELCESYSQKVKVEAAPKPTKQESSYYDENPFQHFNGSPEAEDVLTDHGWKRLNENAKFVWYERPGQSLSKRVGASWNKKKRVYYIFTSSAAPFEPSRGYLPATALAILKFAGDKKMAFKYLVEKGYGKIKPHVEERIARESVISKKPVPANISAERKEWIKELVYKHNEAHPHGVFWFMDEDDKVQIDRNNLYAVSEGLGFRLHKEKLYLIDGKYLVEQEDRDYYDSMRGYVHEEDADLYHDILNSWEVFIERHGKFTLTRLTELPDDLLLHDTREASFKCYKNGILKVTADSIELLPEVEGKLIMKHTVKDRDFILGKPGGRYLDFLEKAIGLSDYLYAVIGYLAMEYKDETTAEIVVLVEQCENPEDGGGSGKNIFSSLFKHITSYTNKSGSQIKYDEKFFQSWNGERIFCISDVPRNFDFGFLKEFSSGNGLLKKLHKDERTIDVADMPKLMLSSNYSVEIKDGGVARRVRMVEFTNYFTLAGGVDVVYGGCHFPNDWSAEDWAGYDNTMALGLQTYLKAGLKVIKIALTESGWAKQYEQTFGQVATVFIREHFDSWVNAETVRNDEFKKLLDDYYLDNSISLNFRPSNTKINRAIAEYCKHFNVEFVHDITKNIDGLKHKIRQFKMRDAAPF